MNLVSSPLAVSSKSMRLENAVVAGSSAQSGEYSLEICCDEQSIVDAQRLRHEVFLAEPGFDFSPRLDGRDVDSFDAACDHLLVRHLPTGAAIGCYRLLPPERAALLPRRYIDTEFELRGFDSVEADTVEIGRACVLLGHRNGTVLAMMWAGILRYVWLTGNSYVLGCVSIPMADPDGGRGRVLSACMQRTAATRFDPKIHDARPLIPVAKNHCVPSDARGNPVCGFEKGMVCEAPGQATAATERSRAAAIPPLLQGYLRIGARTVGEPAYDQSLDVADIVIMLGMDWINERYLQRLVGAAGLSDGRLSAPNGVPSR